MASDKKKQLSAILAPIGKSFDKLWRAEKKLQSAFRGGLKKWSFGLNLGSLPEVYGRAELAQLISRRADKRRRQRQSGS
ncbi:MAG: hypothetical protein H7834_04735 [Magnetococcus sp. YQC-9]